MVKYIYNGVELAALPTVDTATYPYALVVDVAAFKASDFNYDYCVFFCSNKFTYGKGYVSGVLVETIAYPASSQVMVYACRIDSTSWTKVSLTTDDNDYDKVAIPIGSVYVWTSEDIINTDTGKVQYEKTELVQHVFAATPSISTDLDDSKNYVFYKDDYVEGFRIKASASDTSSGGILTYQWHRIEDEEDVTIDEATRNAHMPNTSKEGAFQYYCVVTNTYEGYTATTSSNIVTVIIRTKESVVPKKKDFDQQSASLGWITGKMLQYILKLDSNADDAALINGVLHLFDGQATLNNNELEVI
jgi:hypothetical protein